jgi:hypothetical protein
MGECTWRREFPHEFRVHRFAILPFDVLVGLRKPIRTCPRAIAIESLQNLLIEVGEPRSACKLGCSPACVGGEAQVDIAVDHVRSRAVTQPVRRGALEQRTVEFHAAQVRLRELEQARVIAEAMRCAGGRDRVSAAALP